MMICVIYDSKSEIYNNPFYQLNERVALRTATDLRNSEKSDIMRNPEDYAMFHIGDYDEQTAQINLTSAPVLVCKFHELPLKD